MGEGMCQFMSSPKEIHYFNENKETFYFSRFYFFYIFNSIPFVHSSTFSFAFAKILIKLSFLKKLYNSKK